VDTINQGCIHIVEPDLDAFVRSAVAAHRLKAFTTPQAGDIYMICVPTPFHEGEGIPRPNIDYVLAATRSIASFVKAGDLVILESTSPVGTTEQMAQVLSEAGVDVSRIHMAYCPERVLPGKIMTELVENDRVVGGITCAATEAVSSFYKTFVRGAVLETDAKTAEMCKLTENSFRDVNIAFANELSMICDKEGIDVWNLIRLANRHPRVNILQPGAGVGGHCIAIDPWFIVARNPEQARLIQTAREINNFKTEWAIDQIKIALADASARAGRKPRVACLGLAFKPDIDDLRESPAVNVAQTLQSQGYDVIVVEPNIERHDQFRLVSLEDALKTADVFAILVKHKQFSSASIKKYLTESRTLDFCGVLS
jgi:UDP-N-acetyl-D-mannosaminuronic acid dehydrogenase